MSKRLTKKQLREQAARRFSDLVEAEIRKHGATGSPGYGYPWAVPTRHGTLHLDVSDFDVWDTALIVFGRFVSPQTAANAGVRNVNEYSGKWNFYYEIRRNEIPDPEKAFHLWQACCAGARLWPEEPETERTPRETLNR